MVSLACIGQTTPAAPDTLERTAGVGLAARAEVQAMGLGIAEFVLLTAIVLLLGTTGLWSLAGGHRPPAEARSRIANVAGRAYLNRLFGAVVVARK
jgi:hypothetical protein